MLLFYFLRDYFASCSAGKDHKRAGVADDEIGVKDHITNETELHALRRMESAGMKNLQYNFSFLIC